MTRIIYDHLITCKFSNIKHSFLNNFSNVFNNNFNNKLRR